MLFFVLQKKCFVVVVPLIDGLHTSVNGTAVNINIVLFNK